MMTKAMNIITPRSRRSDTSRRSELPTEEELEILGVYNQRAKRQTIDDVLLELEKR